MKIKEQVITLAQAQILRRLGLTAKSLMIILFVSNDDTYTVLQNTDSFTWEKDYIFHAYTLSELMIALRMDYAGNLMPSLGHFHKWMDDQHINYKTSVSLHCALLIHFIEQKVFTVQEINDRINY